MSKLQLSKPKKEERIVEVKHILKYPLTDIYYCYDCNGNVAAFEFSRNNKKIRNIVPGSSPEAIIEECFYVDDREELAKDFFVDKYGYDPKYLDIVRADQALQLLHNKIYEDAEKRNETENNAFADYTCEYGKLKSARAKVEFVENYIENNRFTYFDLKPLTKAIRKVMSKELRVLRRIDEQENQSANEI